MSEPSVAQMAIAGMAALTVGSFATGVSVLLKVTELTTLISHEKYGVIPRLERVENRVDAVESRLDVARVGDSDR
jgi:hypothetical protein